MKRVDRSTRRVLMRVGGFVRTVARRSIRQAKSVYSEPGQPPKGKTKLLRDSILFGADGDRAVVIGPRAGVGNRSENAAATLEFGGVVTRKPGRVVIPKRMLRSDAKDVRAIPGTTRSVSVFMGARREYEPRPYMGPALEKGAERFPKLFADSVR